MPGFFEDLVNRATGLKAGLLSEGNQGYSGMGPQETDMDVPRNPEATYSDPYTNVKKIDTKFGPTNKSSPFKYDPVTGKPMDAATGQQATSNFPTQQGKADPKAKATNPIAELGKNPSLFKNIFGMDVDRMSENWKNKGGLEGLMANPAFTLGLSIMQSSAQGKPIGADIFDNAVKAGGISVQYADRLKAKQGLIAPISEDQREAIRGVLEEQGIDEPDMLDKMKNIFGGNAEAEYREAKDMIIAKALELAEAESRRQGKKVRFDPRRHGKEAIKILQQENKLTLREDGVFRTGTVRAKTEKIKGNRKDGGPIEAGDNYLVGEEGPEMFVSETNGTIINNDDSKVVSMLLESNPQLKNVSRARAVKILKARFPDYF
jgi:hypothetical protein